MPLFISNSNDRITDVPLLKIVIFTLIFLCIFFVSAELFWRNKGHVPSIMDDLDLWCYEREKIVDKGCKTIVLLGASRIQLDLVPSVLKTQFPDYEIVQLAVDGTSPVPALMDISDDERFCGVIFCGITDDKISPKSWDGQKEHVRYYHREWNLNKKLNRVIRTWFQERLAILNPSLTLPRVIGFLLGGLTPKPSYLTTYSDRYRAADYTKVNIEDHIKLRADGVDGKLRQTWENSKPQSEEEWGSWIESINQAVKKIQDRGGRVVFLRFISSGLRKELEDEIWPRKKYWDIFAKLTDGCAIHFEDVPSLTRFSCPEGSHLDYKDAPAYTKALSDEIKRLGIVAGKMR